MSLNYGNFDGPSRSGITTTGAAVAFRFAKNVSTAKEATLFAPAGDGEQTFGVFMDAADVGDPVAVAFGGIGRLCVDGNAGAIAAGDYLDSDAAGKGTKVTADRGNYGAIALDPSTADGDLIRVYIAPPGSERSTA